MREVRLDYDAKYDVLYLRFADARITVSRELGNLIVNYTKDQESVGLQLLDARQFSVEAFDEIYASADLADPIREVARTWLRDHGAEDR